ncbi:MAG: AgmX/PglI C-terminal domain-containing protein [Polyangiaceae bacterium]
MPESQAPLSIAGKPGGSGPYIIGVVVLVLLIAGLVWWRAGSDDKPPPPITVQAPPPNTVPDLVAPPPPPKIEEPDAGADDAGGKVASTGTGGGKGPCSGKCGDGKSSSALESALRSTASSAQGCYNRALRTSEVSGGMTVSVQVGSSGAVCGASIGNDSVNSGEISSCVLGRFRGRTFPPPESGCVVVNIPIAFTIKQ